MLRRGGSPERLLTTVLFTDIVGSTERAAELGDRGWKDLVARHHRIVRQDLHAFHGRELDTAGDGFFAMFDRPAQAIECATHIIDDLRPLDLRIRASIHMGEAEVMGSKVGGMTVHVASRALAQAGPSEIVVTRTVREVAAGADVTFDDRGVHEFKGVPGEWDLYAVVWKRREAPVAVPVPVPAATAGGRGIGWRTAAMGALLGAVVMAAAAFALLSNRASPVPTASPASIVAQPNSAVAVDAATGAVVANEPVGNSPTGIAADRDTVWALSLGDRILLGIPLTGGPRRTTGLPGSPTGIAVGAGAVWVTFGFGATGASEGLVLRVSTGAERQEQKIPIGNGASAIAADNDGVWVVNGLSNTLTRLDPATRAPVGSVNLAEQPVAVALGGGSVWVAHGLDKSIWRIDPATLKQTAAISLQDPPSAIAVGFGRVWVTSTVGNSVVVIDAATNGRLKTIPLEQGPRGIAIGSDAVWVAGSRNALLRIDPEKLELSKSITLPGPVEGVAVAGNNVWATVQQ